MQKKSPRKYDSTLRSEQAQQTRTAILNAADKLFRAQGWAKTSVAAIAAEAGVSAETIYATLKTKRAIIAELVKRAVRRDAPDTPLIRQARPAVVLNAPDQREMIALFASDISQVLGAFAPLMAVLRVAATTEPELNKLYVRIQQGRRENLSAFAAALISLAHLNEDMALAEATSVIWRLASPEMYSLITEVEGLDQSGFADWLASSLHRILLARN